MKHFFSLITALMLSVTLSYAQTSAGGWRLGFGIDGGPATAKPFQYVLGGDLRLQKDFSDRISGTITAGFSHFFEKDHFDGYNQYGSPYNVIPVKAGIKYFLSDNFYLGGEAGAGFGFEKWGNSFLWSPSIGVAFKNGLDLSIKYEDYTKSSVTKDVALRLAYGLGTRKLAIHKKSDYSSDWQLGISADPGVTTAFSQATLGGEISINKYLTSNLEFSLSAGYTHYFDNNYYHNVFQTTGVDPLNGSFYGPSDVVPVKAGIRLYAGDRFYVGVDAGAAFLTHGNTSFVYTPSIGLLLNNGLDIGIKYDNYSAFSVPDILSVKIGYRIKL
jgi:hypothetical protein